MRSKFYQWYQSLIHHWCNWMKKVPIVPIIPELVWHTNVIDITNVTNGSSVESVYCPNYTTTQFLHKLHPKYHRGKKGFSKLGSYVSIFAVMSKISCVVIYQCFRGPHSRSSAEKNTIVKNH